MLRHCFLHITACIWFFLSSSCTLVGSCMGLPICPKELNAVHSEASAGASLKLKRTCIFLFDYGNENIEEVSKISQLLTSLGIAKVSVFDDSLCHRADTDYDSECRHMGTISILTSPLVCQVQKVIGMIQNKRFRYSESDSAHQKPKQQRIRQKTRAIHTDV